MKNARKNGFVLPAVILILVMVGALVTGGMLMSRHELRSGVANKFGATALNLAQSAINDVLANHGADLSGIVVGDSVTVADTVASGHTSVKTTRLAPQLFYLDATAVVTEGGALWGGATRRLGLVARKEDVQIAPPAALTTQGMLRYGGSSQVHGIDSPPDGSSGGAADWTGTCPVSGLADSPGILIDDTTNIVWIGSRSTAEANMTGNPKFTEDPSITTESLLSFGDMSWDDVTGMAEKVYTGDPGRPGPALSGGVCNTSVRDNWGDPLDPTSPCFDYFPLIYLGDTGTSNISSGYGQGILLVEGDLVVTGGFEFYGPVFVKGTLTTTGAGGHFWGGVTAGNADLSDSTILGDAVITYSSCAVQRALENNSAVNKVRSLSMRGWVDLSAVAGR